MKVKVIEKCFAGTGGNMMPGEEYELPNAIAQKLIDRGYLEEVKKRGRKPKVDRAVWEVETPEDEAE